MAATRSTLFGGLALVLFATGCGGGVRRFPPKAPLARDTDLDPVYVACHEEDDKKAGKKKQVCTPEEYESPFAWDGANQMLFRPLSRLFAVDPPGDAVNVNAFDEVADSAWFTNRMGALPFGPDDVARGFCDSELDPSAADGSWPIDQGKPNGANPGFRVNVPGTGKFMVKADPKGEGERATGATSIASRIYYALGWWAPCDSVVYFRPGVLKLKPGLKVTDNTGVTRDFDEKALARVLDNAQHKGELVRMVASKWLPGPTLGPFTYSGTRDDDPNDVIPHEDRRDLRGARVVAAWLGHYDSREQNSMDTWMALDPKRPESAPGHVRHWYIDLGDCFGSQWDDDRFSRKLTRAYTVDLEQIGTDFITFGAIERPWERVTRHKTFNYFSPSDFDPDGFRGVYPNPAFKRMVERDAAWAARKIARFRDEHVAAAVGVGKYSDPDDVAWLVKALVTRRDIILRRYFKHLSPLGELAMSPAGDLCGTDLARYARVFDEGAFRYGARVYSGERLSPAGEANVKVAPEGRLCVTVPHRAPDGGASDGDASRYVVVDIANGQAPGVLRAHLYDLGPRRGFVLAGVERPSGSSAP